MSSLLNLIASFGVVFAIVVDLLTSRAFERVARLWARSAIVRARSASDHTRPENQANDFEKVYHRRRRCLSSLLGTLRSNDADDNENVKKTIGLISKTTTSHVHHTFLYISFPFLHDYDVKMPNFAFYGGRKQATTKFYLSFWALIWSLEIQLQEGSPTIDKASG